MSQPEAAKSDGAAATEETAERIAALLERLVALMERSDDERDERPVRLPGVVTVRRKRVA